MNSLTALVVSGGGFQGLTLVRALRESDRLRVVVADCHAENVARHFADGFRQVPKVADEQAFRAAVLRVCAEEDVRVVFPSTPHELMALAELQPALAECGVAVAVSDAEFLRSALHKRRLYELLARGGLPVLPMLDLRAASLPFPAIGKPVLDWGGKGILVVRSGDEVSGLPSAAFSEGYVWQPYLEAPVELSVDFGIDFDGVCSNFGVRRRLSAIGGYAVVGQDAPSPEVDSLMRNLVALCQPLGARGLFNVQLLVREGELLVSDVNPRIGTSATHWRGTGFNPVLHVCGSLAPSLRERATHAGVPSGRARVVRYLDELRLDLSDDPGDAESELRAVVFDLDDTLLHHKRWILAKLDLLHARRSESLPSRTLFLRAAMQIVEEGDRKALFDRLAARFGIDAELTAGLIAEYRSVVPANGPLFEDVVPTLETLRRRGFKLALLTDNPPPSQRQKLAASGLGVFFDAVVFSRECGAEKPDPRGFEAVASRLGLPPAALAMVGDNPYRDVLGATGAGYGASYLLVRSGTLFNFDPQVFQYLAEASGRVRVVAGLQGLLRFFPGPAARLDGARAPAP